MSTTETVRVTAEHIANGQPQLPDSCPIALAIRDLRPGADVDVLRGFALIDEGSAGPSLSAVLPLHAVEFIDDFDDIFGGLVVEPFEFELTWLTPEEVL